MRYGNFDTKEGRVDEEEWGVDFFFWFSVTEFVGSFSLCSATHSWTLVLDIPLSRRATRAVPKQCKLVLFNASTKPHSSNSCRLNANSSTSFEAQRPCRRQFHLHTSQCQPRTKYQRLKATPIHTRRAHASKPTPSRATEVYHPSTPHPCPRNSFFFLLGLRTCTQYPFTSIITITITIITAISLPSQPQ
jgi:hypothetical protein